MSPKQSDNDGPESPFTGEYAPAFFGDPLHSDIHDMVQELLDTARSLFPSPMWSVLAIVNGQVDSVFSGDNTTGRWVEYKNETNTIVMDATVLGRTYWNTNHEIPVFALQYLPYDLPITARNLLRHQIAFAFGQFIDTHILRPAELSAPFASALLRSTKRAKTNSIDRIGLLLREPSVELRQLPDSNFAHLTPEEQKTYEIAVGISPAAATTLNKPTRRQLLRADALASVLMEPGLPGTVRDICRTQQSVLARDEVQQRAGRAWRAALRDAQTNRLQGPNKRNYYRQRLAKTEYEVTTGSRFALERLRSSAKLPPVPTWVSVDPDLIDKGMEIVPLTQGTDLEPSRNDPDNPVSQSVPIPLVLPGRGTGPSTNSGLMDSLFPSLSRLYGYDKTLIRIIEKAMHAAVKLCEEAGVYRVGKEPIQQLAIAQVSDQWWLQRGIFNHMAYEPQNDGTPPRIVLETTFYKDTWPGLSNEAAVPTVLRDMGFLAPGIGMTPKEHYALMAAAHVLGRIIVDGVVGPSDISIAPDLLAQAVGPDAEEVLRGGDHEAARQTLERRLRRELEALNTDPERTEYRVQRGIALHFGLSPRASECDRNSPESFAQLTAEAFATAIAEIVVHPEIAKDNNDGRGATLWAKTLLREIGGNPVAVRNVHRQFCVQLHDIATTRRGPHWQETATRVGGSAYKLALQGETIVARRRIRNKGTIAAANRQLALTPAADHRTIAELLTKKIDAGRDARLPAKVRASGNYLTSRLEYLELSGEQRYVERRRLADIKPPGQIMGAKGDDGPATPDDPPLAAKPPTPTKPPSSPPGVSLKKDIPPPIIPPVASDQRDASPPSKATGPDGTPKQITLPTTALTAAVEPVAICPPTKDAAPSTPTALAPKTRPENPASQVDAPLVSPSPSPQPVELPPHLVSLASQSLPQTAVAPVASASTKNEIAGPPLPMSAATAASMPTTKSSSTPVTFAPSDVPPPTPIPLLPLPTAYPTQTVGVPDIPQPLGEPERIPLPLTSIPLSSAADAAARSAQSQIADPTIKLAVAPPAAVELPESVEETSSHKALPSGDRGSGKDAGMRL